MSSSSPSPTTNENKNGGTHKLSSSSSPKTCCAPPDDHKKSSSPAIPQDNSGHSSSGIPVNIFLIRMVCLIVAIAALCSYFISKHFNWFILFVAINYFQSSFSWGICPPTILMGKLGWIDHGTVYLFKKGMPSSAQVDTVTA